MEFWVRTGRLQTSGSMRDSLLFDEVKSDSGELSNMKKEYFCLNIEEAVAEVAACRAFVAECQKARRGQLSLAKAALRSAERELRDWQKGIVPPFAEPQLAMGEQQ